MTDEHPPTERCPHCRVVVQHTDSYCRNCGAHLDGEPPSTPTDDDPLRVPDALADAPTSTRFAFVMLAVADAPLSAADLADRTAAAPRTMRAAVARLDDAGLATQAAPVEEGGITCGRRYILMR